MSDKLDLKHGSGNVFADFGDPDAEAKKLKAVRKGLGFAPRATIVCMWLENASAVVNRHVYVARLEINALNHCRERS
jgi:hypothetical protein